MPDETDGFKAPNADASADAGSLATGEIKKVTTTTTTRESDFKSDPLPTAGDIESNHNSVHKVNPVLTANLIGKPDYNPMRSTPNRANDASDTTLVPESAAHLVETKGERPTQKENVLAGRDMAGNEDVKLASDTILHDPVTLITTRPGASLADNLRDNDREAAETSADRAPASDIEAARI